jgi:hypothetical protein
MTIHRLLADDLVDIASFGLPIRIQASIRIFTGHPGRAALPANTVSVFALGCGHPGVRD